MEAADRTEGSAIGGSPRHDDRVAGLPRKGRRGQVTGSVAQVLGVGAFHHRLVEVQRGDLEHGDRTALGGDLPHGEVEGPGRVGRDLLEKRVLRSLLAQRREHVDVADQQDDEHAEPEHEDAGDPRPGQRLERGADGIEQSAGEARRRRPLHVRTWAEHVGHVERRRPLRLRGRLVGRPGWARPAPWSTRLRAGSRRNPELRGRILRGRIVGGGVEVGERIHQPSGPGSGGGGSTSSPSPSATAWVFLMEGDR